MEASLLESGLQSVQAKKGLIDAEVIHRSEKKYEVLVRQANVGREANQRKLNAILNKLTPHNIGKLYRQVRITGNIETRLVDLVILVTQIYERALREPAMFCEVYADLCFHLSRELPEISVGDERFTFKRVLLNKCQEEFEKEEAYRVDDGGMVQEEEKNQAARCRMLGNIRLIGELFKKRLLTGRVIHDCIKKLLLGQRQNRPIEEEIVALCTLLSIVGQSVDHNAGKPFMDSYFKTMSALSDDFNLSHIVRFMLKDVIELRNNNWQQQKRSQVGRPKEMSDIYWEAVKKWQTQANLLAFGLGIKASEQKEPQTKFTRRVSKNFHSQSRYAQFSPSLPHDTNKQVIRSDDI